MNAEVVQMALDAFKRGEVPRKMRETIDKGAWCQSIPDRRAR